jgi:hypothetical protein
MRDQDPVYDVAISFLYQDLSLAQALYDELWKAGQTEVGKQDRRK